MEHRPHPDEDRYSFAIVHLAEQEWAAQALESELNKRLHRQAAPIWRYDARELLVAHFDTFAGSILEKADFTVHLVSSQWTADSFVARELIASRELAVKKGRAIPRIVFLDREAEKRFFEWAAPRLESVVFKGPFDKSMVPAAEWLAKIYDRWLFNHDIRNSALLRKEIAHWPATEHELVEMVTKRVSEVVATSTWRAFVGSDSEDLAQLDETLPSRMRMHAVNKQPGAVAALGGLVLFLGPSDQPSRSERDWHLRWLSAAYNPLPAWFRGTSDEHKRFGKHHFRRLKRLVRDASKAERGEPLWAAIDVIGRDGDKLSKQLKDVIEEVERDGAPQTQHEMRAWKIHHLRARILVSSRTRLYPGDFNTRHRNEILKRANVAIEVYEYPNNLHPPIHGNAMGFLRRPPRGESVEYEHVYAGIVDAPDLDATDDYYMYLSRIRRPENPLYPYQQKIFGQFHRWFDFLLKASKLYFTLGGLD